MPPLKSLLLPALLYYTLLSLITFAAFALDKSRAQRPGARRIPERTLHTLSALGGVLGAFLAIRLLHHKNKKLPFVLITLALTALHAALWILLLTRFH